MEAASDSGNCTHFQPADLVALAEKHLREAGISESEWDGLRFHWGGAIDSPPFRGLVVQCVRRQGNWAITKLDRRKDGVTADEMGFKQL
jgi:hypothetical protein